jgi:small subunit ribosomal protein S27Ae
MIFTYRMQVAETFEMDAEEIELQYGIQTLEDEQFIGDCGIVDEAEVSVHMSLDGGKKKKKRRPHTTPKVIKHKHKKRPKALLEYFSVDDGTGKVKRLKQESPCAAGVYMADHPDRYTCGKTGTMFYKLTADGARLPKPKIKNPVLKKDLRMAAKEVKKPAGKKGKKGG